MALKGFGYVTVAAAGTPVRATQGLTLQTGQPVQLQSVLIEAHPSNTGLIYIFEGMSTPPADHRTSGAGLLAILAAPASAINGPFPSATFGLPAVPNGVDLNNIWLDTSVSGSKVIVSGTVG